MGERTASTGEVPNKDYGQELFPDRLRRADRYFDLDLGGLRKWYSDNATKAKDRTNNLAITVLAAGASISVIQIFHDQVWAPLLTALLGAVVVLAKGLERIGKHSETWLGYRKASESMKREYRLYINNAGDYPNAKDEEDAYRWFVEQVERILAEEQNQFWQSRGKALEPGDALPEPAD
jgi:hypothetical protein